MPSEAATRPLSGRCYCGACSISAGPLLTAAYCHCTDCRRVTGGPVAAFAAVAEGTVTVTGPVRHVAATAGVLRQFCGSCGSPLTARFDYLPGQVYLPVGVMDDPDALAPRLHAHAAARLCWLHIADDLPREAASSRAVILGPSPAP
ncbi:GFA family protein [Pseudooceanicola sp. C21-150M6]|uniref:GFA family protein n=1 Tax=Pseudooceanicola sp. C21-150M6 TaxID=3434355 RepID=UPI003D7F4AE1